MKIILPRFYGGIDRLAKHAKIRSADYITNVFLLGWTFQIEGKDD